MLLGERRERERQREREREGGLLAYEMLTLRELEHDRLMWEAPSLALTAQAFLFIITLNPALPPYIRATSAGLGAVILLMAMQLMAKNRHLSQLERDRLSALEDELSLPPTARHRWDVNSEGARDHPGNVIVRRSSYRLWQVGLLIVLAVNVGGIIAAIIPN